MYGRVNGVIGFFAPLCSFNTSAPAFTPLENGVKIRQSITIKLFALQITFEMHCEGHFLITTNSVTELGRAITNRSQLVRAAIAAKQSIPTQAFLESISIEFNFKGSGKGDNGKGGSGSGSGSGSGGGDSGGVEAGGGNSGGGDSSYFRPW